MRPIPTIATIRVIASQIAACSAQATPLPAEQVELKAQALAENLSRGDYPAAWCDFDTCTFANEAIDLRVMFNPRGKVAGLFFQSAQAGENSVKLHETPSYGQQKAFEEQEVAVGSGEWALPGRLTLPVGAGPFPPPNPLSIFGEGQPNPQEHQTAGHGGEEGMIASANWFLAQQISES